MNDHQLPDGLANFLDSCGMRAPSLPWLPTADLNRPATSSAHLEAIGMDVGIAGAKEIIRLGINGRRSPLRSSAMAVFKNIAIETFVKDQRATNNLTDEGELAFRRGVDRGLTSQLKHPNARIEIKIVKAPAVV